jgi:DNA-binding transcriptional ArsR family regulator
MKMGPDIAVIAALVGDPARANMLTALMGGQALTATELAQEANVTIQTASSHLSKLGAGGLVAAEKQGRHRYFRLSGEDVAAILEGLMGIASRVGHLRTRLGPKDPELRRARVCYDHLAGEMGVRLFDRLIERGLLARDGKTLKPTKAGERWFRDFGIDLGPLARSARPLCRPCLDWSVRRSHLAGSLGAAILERFYAMKWAHPAAGSRHVVFSPQGRRRFGALLGNAD